jgi:hypothetical protein
LRTNTPSLRGVQRRSNPQQQSVFSVPLVRCRKGEEGRRLLRCARTDVLRCARNDVLPASLRSQFAMTFFLLRTSQFAMTFFAASQFAMTVSYFYSCSFYNSINSDTFYH